MVRRESTRVLWPRLWLCCSTSSQTGRSKVKPNWRPGHGVPCSTLFQIWPLILKQPPSPCLSLTFYSKILFSKDIPGILPYKVNLDKLAKKKVCIEITHFIHFYYAEFICDGDTLKQLFKIIQIQTMLFSVFRLMLRTISCLDYYYLLINIFPLSVKLYQNNSLSPLNAGKRFQLCTL